MAALGQAEAPAGAPRGEAAPRFLADVNLGKLARWLRVLGFDCAFDPEADDAALLRRAAGEGRVLVTRDRGLAGRREVRRGQVAAVAIASEAWRDQIAELGRAVPLEGARPFSRCVRCNLPLAVAPPTAVAGRVPPYVLATQPAFMECRGCGRVYWRGTHWDHVCGVLREVLGGSAC